jgi:hypothetical protein
MTATYCFVELIVENRRNIVSVLGATVILFNTCMYFAHNVFLMDAERALRTGK